MKSKILKEHNLPENRVIEKEINAKPYLLMLFFVLISAFITNKMNLYFGVGVGIISIGLFALLPRKTIIEFSKDYMVVYNKIEKGMCVLIYYDEITSYQYITDKNKDMLIIDLIDGSKELIPAYSKKYFEKMLNKYLEK